jgi:hypothetical protein
MPERNTMQVGNGGSKRNTNVKKQTLNTHEVKVKGKVAPVLFLTEHHAMKTYWGVEV